MTRKEANMEIVRMLVNEINQYPDLRFSQILRNLEVIEEDRDSSGMPTWRNAFYEEPVETLERVMDQLRSRRS